MSGARPGSGSPWWRPRLGVLAAVGMVLVAGLLASAASAESSGRYRWDFPRATASDDPVDDADRPDVTSGVQLHAVYVKAADRPDDRLDIDGVLHDSLLSQNLWFAEQSAAYGGPARRRRMDLHTFGWTDPETGERLTIATPDVTYIASDKNAEQLDTFEEVRDEIQAHGLSSTNKRYLVYVDSTALGRCGEAAAGIAIVRLEGCDQQFASGSGTPSTSETVAVHEVLHTQGAVSPEAPNHCATKGGHVCNTPLEDELRTGEEDIEYDVMHPNQTRPLGDVRLDINRDDYFDHDEDWADAADDLLLEPALPPAVMLADASVVEGGAGDGGTVVFDVALSGPSAHVVTVDVATVDGSAVAGQDYQATTAQLTFDAGVVGRQVSVPVVGDDVHEEDETFALQVTGVDNATVDVGQATGTIVDDDDPPPNEDPTADIVGPGQADEGSQVAFDGSGSTDPDGQIVSHAWTFGDNTSGSGSQVSHTFADDGTYTVALTVTDDDGATDTATVDVQVTNVAPTVDGGDDRQATVGQQIELSATVHDPGDDQVTVGWAFGDGSTATGHSVSHAWDTAGVYSVAVEAVDDDGATGSDALTVTVDDEPEPTESPSPSESESPSPSPSDSDSESPSPSPSDSPSPSPSESESESPSPSPSESESPSPSPSESGSESPSPSESDSESPSPSESESESASPSPSDSDSESASPSPSETESGSASPSPSDSDSESPSPSKSPSGTESESPSESGVVSVSRLAGAGRVETALAVSQDGWTGSEHVVVATGWGFADALAGGGLAAALDAPLLLSPPDRLPEAVVSELDRLDAGTVWLLGGQAALSGDIEQRLDQAGYTVHRIAGPDRFTTAATIADHLGAPDGRVMLALGAADVGRDAWPDALAAGTLTATPGPPAPVLLTGPDRLPDATVETLQRIGADHVDVLGGPAAIGDAVVDRLQASGYTVRRLAGTDRYATSAAAATAAIDAHPDGTDLPLVVATGTGYPDGLTATALAARTGAILLLVPPDDLTHADAVVGFLDQHGHRLYHRHILGGTTAISNRVADQLAQR